MTLAMVIQISFNLLLANIAMPFFLRGHFSATLTFPFYTKLEQVANIKSPNHLKGPI